MKCLVNLCDGSGLIQEQGRYKPCKCQHFKEAYALYLKSGAHKEHMLFPFQLLDKPEQKIAVKNGPTQGIKSHLGDLNENLEKDIEERKHIILFGNMGTGKTLLASSLLLLANFKGYSGLFIDMRSVRTIVKNPKTIVPFLEQAKKVKILILDDLGVESTEKDFYSTDVNNLVDSLIRHHSGLLIVTTNKNMANEKELFDAYPSNQRMISYLLREGCRIFYFGGTNVRGKEL